ncbi:hypothetical protein H3309_04680 [Sandaracinobacteroides saxicola]|uniref:Aromatic amino acid beta-eliminating lyase/threonine aldolase domain-containing protein n=1 Tax=Sandaracinobacteroides saxicola TaxID=2759707 RepID=A0A7G5IK89_9SPHN|nr:beta-eliminating lyase-related protein [Sandaracinobacteroides saxicola]QMW23781.1 hypothetical protein H3309_04680 [Sandaracinobacteroides saxicola]
MLDKEAALFLPSGTMVNVIGVMVRCQRGDEILAERSSHLFTSKRAEQRAWAA